MHDRSRDYAAKDATLFAHSKMPLVRAQLACREEERQVLVDERQHQTAGLRRTALAFCSSKPLEENLRLRELTANLKILDCYEAFADATCELYTDKMDAKMLLMEGAKLSLAQRISGAALGERAGALLQQREAYSRRINALQRQETDLSRKVHSMELEVAALRTEMQRLEARRDTTECEVAKDREAAGASQVTAPKGVRGGPYNCAASTR
ncbi:hypothetical protein JIQ42_02927 [Leishmania sp. Namibia]|uniref:hypothetical protein n=1 Tax=Leishmania sp. Namibia TaxID=2802991 RepID=UPI001B48CD6C|nr:hypothetical protein JIQ42_02927 [Leishmania sp. Namibia]